jgi:NOL1/NOP2/fmu family ribosome biogenesis protein
MRISSVVMNPVSPSILYAGTYSGAGVYRSTDSGDHWTPVSAGLTDQNVRSLAIDPVTPTTLYAGAWGGGVFRYDAASYTLMTAASPTAGGSIGRSPDATSYASGTVVTLTASANLGYHFVNWSGDLTGTTNPTTITMTGNKSVTAVFAPTSSSYSLSLLPSWNVIGVPFPTPASSLTTCDLVLSWDGSLWQMATTLTPGTGYLVRNTGGATTVTLTGTPLSSPQTQPATGTWQIIGNPYPTPASFTCTSTVPYLLTWDGSLWQMASPTNLPPGLGFLLQASSPGTITLTSNAAPPSYALTVTPSPLAGGSVGRSPDAASYASGTVVTLTAAAATGYHFVNWSGDLTGTTNPTTITMSTNRSVTAVFQADAIMYALTTTASPSAGGTIGRSPDAASYASGAVVTLTANANPGYHFVNWSGDLTGTTNPTTITMSTNRSVTAVFEANPLPDLTVDTLYFDPAQPTAGGSVTFNFTIRNQGLAPVAADYSVYIYVDGVPVGTGATDTDRLASGASQGWHWNTTWSSDTASHTFMVVLDPTHVVAESNESNNSASLSASAVIGVPETLEPGQETTVPMLTPTFFWSAVPGAARYTFWLGSGWSGSGETEVYSSVVTGLSLTLPQALVSGAQYTWNVSAGDASSWGDWGEDQHFTVQVPAGLTVTTLLTPIPYATNVSLTPTFTWTAVPGATRYSFWLGTGTSGSGDTEILGVAVTGTSYTVPAGTLEAGGVYTWNVAVGTATTWGGWTMDRYFMVAP